ncbi:MAG TPA: Kiwa anti-phage protein KwaB-like domain-containing protein [Pseudonocardiaceae bacterium]|nr:Kiwa anti-phage protein KwaB-like domain-containing protein [Pseudonocardiaceae bacterium]
MAVAELDLSAPASLVVAWRTGKNAHGRVVKAGGSVLASLRQYANDALAKIASNEGRAYDPNDEQDDETVHLDAGLDELLDTALLEVIQRGASLPLVSLDDLRTRSLALYALVIGRDPENLAAFVRRRNPVQLARKGLVALFDQTLTRVEQPLLAFDDTYDVVIFPGSVSILNQNNFEAIFKESEAVLAKTAEWVGDLARALPISGEGKEWLAKRLRETSVMRRKVLSILKSDYLPTLTPDVLKVKMRERGLDPSLLMSDDELVITRDTEKDILLLLNEDLWTGDFSGEQYAAARKARRR